MRTLWSAVSARDHCLISDGFKGLWEFALGGVRGQEGGVGGDGEEEREV